MRIENDPVTCHWTADELNDKTLSFVPNRSGVGPRVLGQILAVPAGGGLYIQISLKTPNTRSALYWINQEEAKRIQKSGADSGSDFFLA